MRSDKQPAGDWLTVKIANYTRTGLAKLES